MFTDNKLDIIYICPSTHIFLQTFQSNVYILPHSPAARLYFVIATQMPVVKKNVYQYHINYNYYCYYGLLWLLWQLSR